MTVAGAVLAGAGSRMAPVDKPSVVLGGRPLIAWPLGVLATVCEPVAVVCKRDSRLPELPAGTHRWDEPDEPRHPLTGIIEAVRRAGGPVLVCAADMPFVDSAACAALVGAWERSGRPVAAVGSGRLQPVLAVYDPSCLDVLCSAPADAALTATAERLDPVEVPLDPGVVVSVDTPEALAAAERAFSV